MNTSGSTGNNNAIVNLSGSNFLAAGYLRLSFMLSAHYTDEYASGCSRDYIANDIANDTSTGNSDYSFNSTMQKPTIGKGHGHCSQPQFAGAVVSTT